MSLGDYEDIVVSAFFGALKIDGAIIHIVARGRNKNYDLILEKMFRIFKFQLLNHDMRVTVEHFIFCL